MKTPRYNLSQPFFKPPEHTVRKALVLAHATPFKLIPSTSMKYILNTVLIAFALHFGMFAYGADEKVSFADIQKRVVIRDKITNAILVIDKHKRFELTVEKDVAKVRIYTNMKVRDPNEEVYSFPITDEIKLEKTRLGLNEELHVFLAKCFTVEAR